MVVQTIKIVGGTPFIYHYSDRGMFIERDGVMYADAYDLPQFEYTYTETDEPLSWEEAEEILSNV